MLHHLPPEEQRYVHEFVRRLSDLPGLVAIYLIGSASTHSYVRGRSDLDVQVVVDRVSGLDTTFTEVVVDKVSHRCLPCPAEKLELVVYERASLATTASYLLNYNTGRALEQDHVSTDPSKDESFWFVIDISMAYEHAIPLHGPPPHEVLIKPDDQVVLRALASCISWHRKHAHMTPNAVLNTVRAWRWAKTRQWSSKADGIRWLESASRYARLADAALDARRKGEEKLSDAFEKDIEDLFEKVQETIHKEKGKVDNHDADAKKGGPVS